MTFSIVLKPPSARLTSVRYACSTKASLGDRLGQSRRTTESSGFLFPAPRSASVSANSVPLRGSFSRLAYCVNNVSADGRQLRTSQKLFGSISIVVPSNRCGLGLATVNSYRAESSLAKQYLGSPFRSIPCPKKGSRTRSRHENRSVSSEERSRNAGARFCRVPQNITSFWRVDTKRICCSQH